MQEFIVVYDIIEENGKTIKENNFFLKSTKKKLLF